MDRKQFLQSKNPEQPVFLEPKVAVPWPLRKGVDMFMAKLHAGGVVRDVYTRDKSPKLLLSQTFKCSSEHRKNPLNSCAVSKAE